MKSKQGVAAALLTALFSAVLLAGTAFAAEGWVQADGSWSYYDKNGDAIALSWKKSGDDWFYLSGDGAMLTDKLFKDGDSTYYVDSEGKMARSTWLYADADKIDGSELEEGWYYLGADGKAYKKKNNNGKKSIGSDYYIFDEDGKMLTGWFDASGEPIDDSENPFVDGMYYSRADGKLLKEEWLDYGAIDEGIGGSDLESEVSGRSYADYDRMWIYFDSSAKKVKSNGNHIRQKNIGTVTYGFDENGIMLPWWSKIATISDADKSNPSTDVPPRYYSGYDGGKLLRNKWFWMYPSENIDSDEYYDQECSWWFAGSNGEVYKNRISKIYGKYYAFDGIGRMQTGFVLFDGKSEYVAKYKVDDWSSEDFKYGYIYGIEKSDLYLFSPDEFNDGSMQTGDEIQVELYDGVHTFGFGSSGKAYGNRNQIQKKNNKYYINGLRLEADEEYGYGVVEVESGDDLYYQVVDAKGKVVEGKKKLVKDKDGAYLIIIGNRFVARVNDESKPRWFKGDEGEGYYHYDKDNKANHYAGGLIAGDAEDPDVDSLPEEERLNF